VSKIENRTRIVTLRELGWKWDAIVAKMSKEYNFSITTRSCMSLMKKYKESGTVDDQARSGRPKSLTQREERLLCRSMRVDRRKNAREVIGELQERCGKKVCKRTVLNILRKYGLRRRVAVRRPLLTKRMRRDRLQWAKDHYKWTVDKWKGVVFSDEKIFRIGSNARGVYVTRLPSEKYNDACIQRTVKHGLQVHVWGVIGWNGVGELKLVSGNLSAAAYQESVINDLAETGRAVANRNRRFTFQQDNAPAHTAGSTKHFLTTIDVRPLSWSGNSPDINPIENAWSVVAKAADYNVTNKDQLFESVRRAWNQVSVQYIRKLYHSMPRRLREVIQHRGGSTHY
jgi:transposase